MAQNVYEMMYIFDSNRYVRDPGGVAALAERLVTQFGGEVMVSRLWDERRLETPINGHRKGTYWLVYFRMDSLKLTELNRQCQITDEILRHLVLKVEPRLVDTLVAHAKGEVTSLSRNIQINAEDDLEESVDDEKEASMR